MCGICGIKGLAFAERNRRVSQMSGTLCHRGPDEESAYRGDDISLGVRRLSIIDLETGSQPIYNEDKSIAVVCNGEIYNFQALRGELEKKGHVFRTNSDVEVLAHLYEQDNTDCLKRIRGMFSFALWDKNKKVLFIARDRFGIKPLYYYRKNGIFAFSSELKALLKLPFIDRELDIQALSLYFSLEYIPAPHSIFKDIHKLRPAHYLLCKDNHLEIRRYWDLGRAPVSSGLSHHQARDRLGELLKESVKEHLISDVPLGIFASGGMDSSVLVALCERLAGRELSTFSIGFEEKSFDESSYAQLVSRHFGTKHHSYVFTINDFIDNFFNVTSLLDEPLGDLSLFPTYMLSKFSRSHIKVALSGEGGDELFMGYPTYRAHSYMNLCKRFPRYLKKGARLLTGLLPASDNYFSLDFKLRQFMKGINEYSPVLRHMIWMQAFLEEEKKALFASRLRGSGLQEITGVNLFARGLLSRINTDDPYKLIQYLDIFTYLSDNLLVKSDRASMFSSLEVRVPYLDHRLVEFIWDLESKLIYQKRLLKSLAKDMIPRRILSRPKQGFPIPFSLWLRDKRFFKTIEEFFDKGFIDRQGLFDHEYVNFLLSRHLRGKDNHRRKLRTYIMFQAWHRKWSGHTA